MLALSLLVIMVVICVLYFVIARIRQRYAQSALPVAPARYVPVDQNDDNDNDGDGVVLLSMPPSQPPPSNPGWSIRL